MKTPVRFRIALMVTLVACFATQTYLVYSDPTGEQNEPLSEQALAGREIWLGKNCQSCHQLYGFGGFLGPDLTNAAPRLEQNRLKELLTVGSRQMPAFNLNDDEIAQVFAFLIEIDKTGVGQARQPSGNLSPDKFESFVNAAGMSAQQKAGRDTFMGMCTACHKPLEDALVGSTVAPDPTSMAAELKVAEILEVLDAGRPDKGMPAFAIKGDRAAEIVAFLQWLAEQRDELQKQQGDADAGVPWFEYE